MDFLTELPSIVLLKIRTYHMFRKTIFTLGIGIVFLSCGNDANVNKPIKIKDTLAENKARVIKSGLVEGIEIIRIPKSRENNSMGRIGDTLIFSTVKGEIEISDTLQNGKHKIIDLKVPIILDKLFLVPRPNNEWLVVWQETFQEGIRTGVALYAEDPMKPKWKVLLPVPNPARPVVDGNDVYVSALGLVGKISLADGNFIWKKDSLFDQSNLAFQKIEKALVYSDRVVFVDFPIHGLRERRDSLVLDPETGNVKK